VTEPQAGVGNRERQGHNQKHQPRSNKRLHLTPLRVEGIGAILKVRIANHDVSIHTAA